MLSALLATVLSVSAFPAVPQCLTSLSTEASSFRKAPLDSVEVYYANGDYAAVVRLVEPALSESPRRLLLLGWSQFRLGRVGEARETFALGLSRAEGNADLELGLAYSLYRLGIPEEAETRFVELLDRNPGDDDARFGLALVLFTGGRFEEALPHFDELQRRIPEEPAFETYIEKCVDGHLSAMREEGRELYELVLSGWSFAARGLDRSAYQIFRWVLARDPFHPGARLGIGAIAPRIGRIEEARKALEALILEDPGDLAARLALARLELAEGHAGPAREQVGRILSERPDLEEALELLRRIDATEEVASP